MHSVVYNSCFGGFSLSEECTQELESRLGDREVDRDDPVLVEIVRAKGPGRAGGPYSNLRIKEIPDKYRDSFYIQEYDGYESVVIDFKGWKLRRIDEILKKDMEPRLKVDEIQHILDEEEEE